MAEMVKEARKKMELGARGLLKTQEGFLPTLVLSILCVHWGNWTPSIGVLSHRSSWEALTRHMDNSWHSSRRHNEISAHVLFTFILNHSDYNKDSFWCQDTLNIFLTFCSLLLAKKEWTWGSELWASRSIRLAFMMMSCFHFIQDKWLWSYIYCNGVKVPYVCEDKKWEK